MLEIKAVRLHVVRKPTRTRVTIDPSAGSSVARIFSDPLEVEAEVDVDGDRSTILSGTRIGFAQIEESETERLSYRGKGLDDGSIDVLMDEPPARPIQPCRDSHARYDPFTYPLTNKRPVFQDGGSPRYPLNMQLYDVKSLPATLHLSHFDDPSSSAPVSRHNSLTGKDNFISSVHSRYSFYTILVIDRGVYEIDQIGYFRWSLEWKTQFHISPWRVHDDVRATAHVSNVTVGEYVSGPVPDPTITASLRSRTSPTCNELADRAGENPIVRERRF